MISTHLFMLCFSWCITYLYSQLGRNGLVFFAVLGCKNSKVISCVGIVGAAPSSML